jgi:hypothetical protein
VVAAVVLCAPAPAEAGFRETAFWRAVRTAFTLPVTVAATTVAVAARATCAWDARHWVVVCTRPRAPIFRLGGTTYGATFVTPQSAPDACLVAHEARHGDQYVLGLGDPLPFVLAYAVAEATKGATGGFNLFERDAGLEDGGYVAGPAPRRCRSLAPSPEDR